VQSESESVEGRVPHLVVACGDRLCALPLGGVRRVVRALDTHPLPGSAPELAGLAEFGGEPVPVLDLAMMVGAQAGPSPAFPVTVLAWVGPVHHRELVGLAVDQALEVVGLAPREILRSGEGILLGEVLVDTRPVAVLDLERLAGS
jgi:chemotaxis signal transduction protein